LVATLPFQAAFRAVTCPPACVMTAFQPLLNCWPAAKDQTRLHEVSGSPRLVIATLAVNPVFHWFATV
jgi:hypothetical protein